MQILEGNEFEKWRSRESDRVPTIIQIHDSITRNDPNTERDIVNLVL